MVINKNDYVLNSLDPNNIFDNPLVEECLGTSGPEKTILPKTEIAPSFRPSQKQHSFSKPQCFRCYVSFTEGTNKKFKIRSALGNFS